jgi:hypothetical protein
MPPDSEQIWAFCMRAGKSGARERQKSTSLTFD